MPSESEIAQALLTNYEPSLRDRIGNAIYDVARSLGMGSTANRMRNEAMSAVDFVPMVGDAVGFDDAINDFRAGNYGMGAAGLGLTAVGVVPGVGDAVANAGRKGIRAFHGSPHSFDKFSMDKIGTGEGAQAYGHGLYFAENEDVARGYRDRLSTFDAYGAKKPNIATVDGVPAREISQDVWEVADQMASGGYSDVDELIASLRQRLSNSNNPNRADVWRDLLAQAERTAGQLRGKSVKFDAGHMYEVNINANPDDFLDWDAPLSAQSPKVQDAYQRFSAANPEYVDPKVAGGQYENPTGKDFLGAYGEWVPHDNNDMFNYRRKFTDDLSEAGIPGIKYLDQGSRGAGEGSRNFVVFDDSLIEIVRKYGLAGAVAAGLISQQMAEQMEQQGMGEL